MKQKQRRAYRTLLSGLKLGKQLGETSRFLTLSTSDIQQQNEEYRGLNYSFKILTAHIRRLTINKLLQDGYLKQKDVRFYYGNYPPNKPFKFEYFDVRTNEGNGVIHCPYRGNYIPYPWLVDTWNDIHNSWHVSIEKIKNNQEDILKSTNYIVTQYISDQKTSYQRSSRSTNWLFPKATKIWHTLVYQHTHDKYGFPKQLDKQSLIDRWEEIINLQSLKRLNQNYKLNDYF